MQREWKWLRPVVWGFYLVVVPEFLVMLFLYYSLARREERSGCADIP
jgi:hypothetical protein